MFLKGKKGKATYSPKEDKEVQTGYMNGEGKHLL